MLWQQALYSLDSSVIPRAGCTDVMMFRLCWASVMHVWHSQHHYSHSAPCMLISLRLCFSRFILLASPSVPVRGPPNYQILSFHLCDTPTLSPRVATNQQRCYISRQPKSRPAVVKQRNGVPNSLQRGYSQRLRGQQRRDLSVSNALWKLRMTRGKKLIYLAVKRVQTRHMYVGYRLDLLCSNGGRERYANHGYITSFWFHGRRCRLYGSGKAQVYPITLISGSISFIYLISVHNTRSMKLLNTK